MIDEKNRATILSLPPDKCNSILPAIDGGRFSETSHLKGIFFQREEEEKDTNSSKKVFRVNL